MTVTDRDASRLRHTASRRDVLYLSIQTSRVTPQTCWLTEEMDLLEAALTFETDPDRQMRLALAIQSRRLQLEAMAQP